MTIEELKKYKWFVATCKYEGIVGKKHCFTYDVDNLNTNLLSGMILVDDELVKEWRSSRIWWVGESVIVSLSWTALLWKEMDDLYTGR